ncbi:hypothetical protein CN404_30520 [Bacillus thuringiensis]|uniref:N-acetylmuramoyl-L-alanine amidase family protein n=1 Tax=Bacillus thuringiensis TaxID=1428 RepID=UPI0009AAF12C|nr:insecticidal delta-endotoxin Cry8Ea1 family protein [Bacillus thuringiensis]PFB40139.1 hypothetical protein CN404_30520 [Bacillus thuringiensis]
MKYKDRKSAKRKYKQALLATVATMTLGVSTLGSTASVFAAEDTGNVSFLHPKKEPAKKEDPMDILNWNKYEDVFNKNRGNSIAKLTGAGLKEIFSQGNKSAPDFNQLAKTLTMTAIDLFPGGMFITPLLNLFWPSAQGSNGNETLIKNLTEKLTKVMDEKIDAEHLNQMTNDFKALIEDITRLQNFLNNHSKFVLPDMSFTAFVDVDDSQLYSGTNLTSAGAVALNIESAFTRILTQVSDEKHDTTDLMLYTNVANIHLQFLKYIEKYGASEKFGLSKLDLEKFFKSDTISSITEKYAKHIEDTHSKAMDKLNKRIEDLGGNEETLNNKIKEVENSRAQRSIDPDAAILQEKEHEKWKKEEVTKLKANIEKVKEIETEKQNLTELTIKNEGFKAASGKTLNVLESGFFKQNGKTYYRGYRGDETKVENGTLATGWQTIKGKTYYFGAPGDNTKVENNTAATGWQTIKGKTYYFGAPGDNTKVENNTAATGLQKIGGKTYYFGKPGDGTTVDNYTMATGWVVLDNGHDWYYCAPSDLTTDDGKHFSKGELLTNTEFTINGKTHVFPESGRAYAK